MTKQFLLKPKKGERLGETIYAALHQLNFIEPTTLLTKGAVGQILFGISDKELIKAIETYRNKK